MLKRSALPLLRPRALPSPVRLSLAAQQSRRYAKAGKPGKNTPPKPAAPFSRQPAPNAHQQQRRVVVNPNSSSQPKDKQETSEEQASQGQQQPEEETKAEFPQKPLPDLTQGIPSTLAAELNEAQSRSKKRGPTGLNLTEDPDRVEAGEEGEGGGDLPKNPYVSSIDRKRNQRANLLYLALLGGLVSGTAYLGRNWDDEEEEKKHPETPSGWGFGLFFDRIQARLSDLTSYYKDPPFPKLLPDEDPQFRQPYTLVLSLEDLLVHSEWTREHGWRVAKRPGVDYFLRYLNQYYELVLFTSVPSMMADQVLRKLDPYRIIRWPLFREATRYKDGEYIKDLSYLNRDLSKVIMIDTHAAHAKNQPENAIVLPKWTGDPKDKSLVALIPFLEYLAGMGIEDVRPVLKSFDGKYIPLEFSKREQAMRERFEKQMAEERAKRPKRSVASLSSLLGLKPSTPMYEGMESTSDGLDEGKMLWDMVRERGQKQYQLIEKEIRENGEKWLAEMAAEEEKARQEQMKGMKSSVTGFFGVPDQEKK